jgi:anti-sigma B factor antagonist
MLGDPVETTTENVDGVAVVVVRGDLDAAHADRLAECFGRLLAESRHDFVVDMAEVEVVDGTGLATLVELFKRVRIGPGDVRLCGLQAWVKVVFVMTRLNRVFDTFGDRAAAVASYQAGDG